MERQVDDPFDILVQNGTRPTDARLIQEAVQAPIDESSTPFPDRLLADS